MSLFDKFVKFVKDTYGSTIKGEDNGISAQELFGFQAESTPALGRYSDVKPIATPVTPYILTVRCEQCGSGMYKYDTDQNITLRTRPPMYPHKCQRCGHVKNFRCKYPRIVYSMRDSDPDVDGYLEVLEVNL